MSSWERRKYYKMSAEVHGNMQTLRHCREVPKVRKVSWNETGIEKWRRSGMTRTKCKLKVSRLFWPSPATDDCSRSYVFIVFYL